MLSTKRRHKICGAKDARGKTMNMWGEKKKEIKAQKSERMSRKKGKDDTSPVQPNSQQTGITWMHLV